MFDVYVGKDDDVIRRVSATLEVTVPEADRERFNGIEGGSLRISIELSDVNGDQTVEAPPDSRPIKDLSTQLGGFGALGGQGLGGATSPDPEQERPLLRVPRPGAAAGHGRPTAVQHAAPRPTVSLPVSVQDPWLWRK